MADPNHVIPTILRELGLVQWTREELHSIPNGPSISVLYNQTWFDAWEYHTALDWLYERVTIFASGSPPRGFHLTMSGSDAVYAIIR